MRMPDETHDFASDDSTNGLEKSPPRLHEEDFEIEKTEGMRHNFAEYDEDDLIKGDDYEEHDDSSYEMEGLDDRKGDESEEELRYLGLISDDEECSDDNSSLVEGELCVYSSGLNCV